MCKCTPNKRTPYCGQPGCEWPARDELAPQANLQTLVRDYTRRWEVTTNWVRPDLRDSLRFMVCESTEVMDALLRKKRYARNNPTKTPDNEAVAIEVFDCAMMACIAADHLEFPLEDWPYTFDGDIQAQVDKLVIRATAVLDAPCAPRLERCYNTALAILRKMNVDVMEIALLKLNRTERKLLEGVKSETN